MIWALLAKALIIWWFDSTFFSCSCMRTLKSILQLVIRCLSMNLITLSIILCIFEYSSSLLLLSWFRDAIIFLLSKLAESIDPPFIDNRRSSFKLSILALKSRIVIALLLSVLIPDPSLLLEIVMSFVCVTYLSRSPSLEGVFKENSFVRRTFCFEFVPSAKLFFLTMRSSKSCFFAGPSLWDC